MDKDNQQEFPTKPMLRKKANVTVMILTPKFGLQNIGTKYIIKEGTIHKASVWGKAQSCIGQMKEPTQRHAP